MATNTDILTAASEHVRKLFLDQLPPWSVYHTYEHTCEVVDAAAEIAKASRLGKSDLEVVLLAAWFHDAGYTKATHGHERESVEMAKEFLARQNYPPSRVDAVAECILATDVSRKPATPLEMIVRDADTLHIGRKSFFVKSQLLRLELERRNGESFTEIDWLNKNLDFLARNQFLTEYARSEYGERREKNMLVLQEEVRKLADEQAAQEEKRLRKKRVADEKAGKETMPYRGIETLFRTVPAAHLNLSAIADHKANIMLSSNALIVSLVFGLLLSKLDTNAHLMVPTFLLLAVCLTAMVFAILSTRPKVTSGTFTREDILNRRVNLLFFGNFHHVPLEDFEWGMKEMMSDREYLYGSMVKDLYNLGQVLERKYRYLRICYNVFMYGLIASVIAFLISFLAFPRVLS
jgi:hypothetical protein